MNGYAPDGGPNGSMSPAAVLSDLTGRMTRAEERVTTLSSDLAEIGAGQADLTRLVEQLGHHVAGVEAAIGQQDGQPDDDDETAIVDWSRLDRDGAEQEWARLYDWVSDWLVPTYGITIRELPVCWPHHAAVREELSWLRTCWMQTYRRPGASASAAAEWHTRWLPALWDNLGRHFARTSCNLGKHAGELLPEDVRKVDAVELSTRQRWLDEGRQADLAARPDRGG